MLWRMTLTIMTMRKHMKSLIGSIEEVIRPGRVIIHVKHQWPSPLRWQWWWWGCDGGDGGDGADGGDGDVGGDGGDGDVGNDGGDGDGVSVFIEYEWKIVNSTKAWFLQPALQ